MKVTQKSTHLRTKGSETPEEERGVSAGSESGEGRAIRAFKVRESCLMAELNEKLHLIKQLQASVEEAERIKEELQNQNKRLMNENISLSN